MKILSILFTAFKKILKPIVVFCFKIIGKELTNEEWNVFLQFVKFCIVGVSNTAISLIIYYIFIIIDKNLYIIGNVVGFIVSVLNSYFLNSKFVFKKENDVIKTILKTFIAYGTNLILGTISLYLLVNVFFISEYIVPLINLLITIPLNFILNKKWVMK